MNFGFTEEQNLLRDQVTRFMTEACPMSKVRDLTASNACFDATLWQQMADLGWLGLITPEAYGGLGLKWIDQIRTRHRQAVAGCGQQRIDSELASYADSATPVGRRFLGCCRDRRIYSQEQGQLAPRQSVARCLTCNA